MLVLARQVDDEIVIGDDIRIKVVAVNGNQVRLGIVAPAHVSIFRSEVYEAVVNQNASAAHMSPQDLNVLAHRHKDR
jgi:carbon storage regulator